MQRHLQVCLWNACPGKQGSSTHAVVLLVEFVDGGRVGGAGVELLP